MRYTVHHAFRDEHGCSRSARWNMRTYKNLDVAKRCADSVRGGYVCPLGSNTPVYVGSWPL